MHRQPQYNAASCLTGTRLTPDPYHPDVRSQYLAGTLSDAGREYSNGHDSWPQAIHYLKYPAPGNRQPNQDRFVATGRLGQTQPRELLFREFSRPLDTQLLRNRPHLERRLERASAFSTEGTTIARLPGQASVVAFDVDTVYDNATFVFDFTVYGAPKVIRSIVGIGVTRTDPRTGEMEQPTNLPFERIDAAPAGYPTPIAFFNMSPEMYNVYGRLGDKRVIMLVYLNPNYNDDAKTILSDSDVLQGMRMTAKTIDADEELQRQLQVLTAPLTATVPTAVDVNTFRGDSGSDNCVPSNCRFDHPGDCPPGHCWGILGQFMCCDHPPLNSKSPQVLRPDPYLQQRPGAADYWHAAMQ